MQSGLSSRLLAVGRCLCCCKARRASGVARKYAALPEVHTRVLSPEETRGRRIIIVGDPHGCNDELQALLGLACFSQERRDLLIFAGDLVAKGPASRAVVQTAIESGALMVRGNHDHFLLKCADEENSPSSRYATAEHFRLAHTVFSPSELAWLSSAPLSIVIQEHNVRVAHAGWWGAFSNEGPEPNMVMNMRGVLEDGSLSTRSDIGVPWATQWAGPEHIVFGHDAKRGLQRCAMATGLDTGACYGGKLSALLLPAMELLQVPSKKVYCTPGQPPKN